jgi:hypothetical protein
MFRAAFLATPLRASQTSPQDEPLLIRSTARLIQVNVTVRDPLQASAVGSDAMVNRAANGDEAAGRMDAGEWLWPEWSRFVAAATISIGQLLDRATGC